MNDNRKNNNIIPQGLKKRTAVIGFALLLFLGGVVIFSDITKPHTFHDGDIISAGQMNENLDMLYAKVNELENYIIEEGLRVPTGTILPFGGDTDKVPEGWKLCDGNAYPTIGEYEDLYKVIGSNFGAYSGYFNVPDLRGMFLRGADNGAGVDPDAVLRTSLQSGGNTGILVGSMQVDAFQGHWHTMSGILSTDGDESDGSSYFMRDAVNKGSYVDNDEVKNAITGNHGEVNISTETRPKNVYVNFIIKY